MIPRHFEYMFTDRTILLHLADAADDVKNIWQSKADDYSIVQCAMLYGLELGLQRRFERHGAYEMFQELKLIFQANARIERYEVSNKF